MHDSYTRHECGITTFVPTRRSRFTDLCVLAASFLLLLLLAFKLYLIWRTFA